MQFHARWVSPLVLVCFFVSGMAGLVYQTAWARYLGLFLGHASYAVIAVLVAFMGGLAVGNAWLGGRADRTPRPLALYGWLEIGIGLYALAFPFYYQWCHDVYASLVSRVGAGTFSSHALKFVFSFITIFPPTVMMGATLPALTRFVTRSLSELRERVASLYFINSGGAVLGCILADFWWLRSLGLESTVFVAAALNLVVGVVALVLSRHIGEHAELDPAASAPVPAPGAETPGERFTAADLRLAVLGIGASGFVAMLYEVVWTRMLGLALGSSTHAFSLMLITFISGITVGSWLISRWRLRIGTLDAFGWAELALAATLAISMIGYEYLPWVFASLASFFNRTAQTYPLYAALQAVLCFAVMFIPTVCLGTTLPLVSHIATRDLAQSGGSVGRVFAVNTVGTVLGAALTGLWLLPALGLARTLGLGVALNAAVAFLVLGRHRWHRQPSLLGALVLFILGWTWLMGALFDARWRVALTAGFWRHPSAPPNLSRYYAEMKANKSLYYRDGAGSTVNVVEMDIAGKPHRILRVNGKTDASTSEDMKTQVMSGHIPMFLKPNARQVLVVGLGCGVTCGAVVKHPGLERLDLVEISREVVEASSHFDHVNGRVLHDPRVTTVIDDAKSFLLATPRQYDVIISEPSNPWMAGVAGVFSREFYETCRSRLAPGGIMVQWVQAYESNDDALNMMVGTFSSSFPYLGIWQGWMDDLLLVGSPVPFSPDLAAMETRFRHPEVRADLDRIGVVALPVFLAHEIVTAPDALFLPPVEQLMHSDFFPALEYVAQRAFFVKANAMIWRELDQNYNPRATTLLGQYLRTRPLSDLDYRAFEQYYFNSPLFPGKILRSLEQRRLQENPESTAALAALVRIGETPSSAELETLRFRDQEDRFIAMAATNAAPLRHYGLSLVQAYRQQRTVFHVPPAERIERVLMRLIETDPTNVRIYRLQLAEIASDRGDDARMFEFATRAFDPNLERGGPLGFGFDPAAPPAVLYRMIDTLTRLGRLTEAADLVAQAERERYIGPGARRSSIQLEVLCRKVRAASTPVATQ